MAVMAREAWTDERLDDLQKHMDGGFREVKEEQRELRGEMVELRKELKEEITRRHGETKEEIGRLADSLDRLNYALIAGLIGLIATHYLG
jgi:hypothetical protein